MSDKIKKTKTSTKTSEVKKPKMEKKSAKTNEIEKEIKVDIKNIEEKSLDQLSKNIRSSKNMFFKFINFLGMAYVIILILFLVQFALYKIWNIEIMKMYSVPTQQKIGIGFFTFGNVIYRIRSIAKELITKKVIVHVFIECLIFIISANVLIFETMDMRIYIPKWI